MDQIGKYRVIRVLGQGGFGTVFLAEDPMLKLQVAIKVYTLKDTASAQQITSASQDAAQVLKDRFLNEARILRQLSRNPYVIELYEFDALPDGTPYYVMPYLEKSLVDEVGKDALDAQVLAELPQALRPRKLGLSRTLQVIDQLLQALSDVHAAGLVHRDIKPANVLVAQDGDIRLTDFGVAKLPDTEHSQTGLALGSRNYMSPEQRESAKHVDARSDIYSVGVLMYRLISGTLPVGRFSDALHYEPALGDGLNRWILTCLETDKTKRFPDATAALTAFRHAKAEAGTSDGHDEQSGTFVSGLGATLKSELKPLQQKIAELLKTEGMVDSAQLKALSVAADIAGLSEADLTLLILETKAVQPASVQCFIKWREKVEAAKVLNQGRISQDEREALLAGGVLLGKIEAELTRFLPAATSVKTNASSNHSTHTASSHSETRKPSKGLLAAGIAVMLLAGGGYYGYSSYQQIEAERTQDLSAWQQAKRADTVDAYQQYLNQIPQGQYRQSAAKAMEQLMEAEQVAKKLAVQQELENQRVAQNIIRTTTMLAQQWLLKLGYDIAETGELDARTKAAVVAFQTAEKMLPVAVIDKTLLNKLEEVYWRNDKNAFAKAKEKNTAQSYQKYLDTYPDGKYLNAAQLGIDAIRTEARQQAEAQRTQQQAATQESSEAKKLRLAGDQAFFIENINSKALGLYQQASKLGSVYADAMLAILYSSSDQVDKNIELARKYRKQAQQKLGYFTFLGGYEYFLLGHMAKFVEQDYATALTHYQKGASLSNGEALNAIGFLYLEGNGVPQSDSEAATWFKKAAQTGSLDAHINLGNLYKDGRGVPQSDKEAVTWFKLPAEKGSLVAQILLGQMHEQGRGVVQSDKEAVNWYRKAAERGHYYAQNQLGAMYLSGKGVPKSESLAFNWIREAVKTGGTATAQNNLGRMYFNGWGVVQSDSEAANWFRKAAEQGNAAAQNWLAFMYQAGRGVAQSESEAVKWYKKAAKQGDKDAQEALQKRGVKW